MNKHAAWILAVPLVLLTGCLSRVGDESVDITLQGQFEKRELTPLGFAGTKTLQPTRHAYAEVIAEQDGAVLVAGYLDENGRGVATVPQGETARLVIYADYQVPNSPADGSFFMNGSVKQASRSASYRDASAFNALPEWRVTSDPFTAYRAGTLELTAREVGQEAGAFNIADQMVGFGLGVRSLDPALRLPDLHAFWDPANSTALTAYPEVAQDGAGYALLQTAGMGGRTIFQTQIRNRAVPGSVVGEGYADGHLTETFAHLLFADYSSSVDASSSAPLLRRDNDAVSVDRGYASESSIAFIDGFCDFLSGGLRDSRAITSLDSAGNPSTFYLDDGTVPKIGADGEFYRGAVAVNLYGNWKESLGGGSTGLRTLWQATQAASPGEYMNAPLGCYPTYLTGLKRLVGAGSPAWSSIASRFASDVTAPAYFAGSQLWVNIPTVSATYTGALRTYAPADGIYYDRDQAQAFRFTQSATEFRLLQLTPTGGQDLFLELLGPTGWVAWSIDGDTVPKVRAISRNLPPGDYVVRVRVGNTTAANPAAGYTLLVQ